MPETGIQSSKVLAALTLLQTGGWVSAVCVSKSSHDLQEQETLCHDYAKPVIFYTFIAENVFRVSA